MAYLLNNLLAMRISQKRFYNDLIFINVITGAGPPLMAAKVRMAARTYPARRMRNALSNFSLEEFSISHL